MKKNKTFNKNSIYIIVALAIVWIILREQFSLFDVVAGLALGVACLYFYRKFLPLGDIQNVSFLKLIGYPFYLIGQIYLSGWYVIKIIFTGARVEVVDIDTTLKNDTLRVILADSITLTPGSILLELKDNILTLLWLRSINAPESTENAGTMLKSGLEDMLLKGELDSADTDK